MLIERSARYTAQQPVDMELVPAWQVQGIRALLSWQHEEDQAARWAAQARGAGRG